MDAAVLFEWAEIPFFAATAAFAAGSAWWLNRSNVQVPAKEFARAMYFFAAGFAVMALGHLILEADEFFHVRIMQELFGETGGEIAWFLALIATLGFSIFGMYQILRVSQLGTVQGVLREARREAETDAMTGALNRRGFERLGAQLFRDHSEQSLPIGCILFDLDNLKPLNDRLGHAAGDAALQGLCEAVTGELRDSDLFARLGGDEFCVLTPGNDYGASLRLAERLRSSIDQLSIPHKTGDLSLTASFGVSVNSRHGDNLGEVMEAADQALYRAKLAGGNRID